jgi:aminoglycoside phosphotransferase family enzyme
MTGSRRFSLSSPDWGQAHLTLDAIVAYVERFLNHQTALLEQRVARGRVREGHGDLHAASICVENDRIHLFDCIEFSARIRCGDVAAEVAFLSMDLDHYGRPYLASAFVDAYVEGSRDIELRSLLDFYKCYRAYVRGKVAGLRLAEADLTPAETDASMDGARAYFDLARSYTQAGRQRGRGERFRAGPSGSI